MDDEFLKRDELQYVHMDITEIQGTQGAEMYKELNSDVVKFVKLSQESDKSLDRRTLGLNVVQSCFLFHASRVNRKYRFWC